MAETKVITATAGAVTLSDQPTVQFVAGTARKLGFTLQPTKLIAGTFFLPPVQVSIEDGAGNPVTGTMAPITIPLNSTDPNAVLKGTLTAMATNGVATFPNLSIEEAGTGYTLTAMAPELTQATSAMFDVVMGPETRLAFQVPPADVQAGQPFASPVTVEVQDAYGNVVTTAMDAITIALGFSIGRRTVRYGDRQRVSRYRDVP